MDDSGSHAVKILAFAGAKEIVGRESSTLRLDLPCDGARLMDVLCARYPELGPRRHLIRLAINGVYAEDSAQISAGDEVALIPPVAGG